ncbi:hypothetical protein J6590_003067 [Homalodisca vitripennis]|nr:hypothetical protein J6590_003067 [Homalodisca vitripennis]
MTLFPLLTRYSIAIASPQPTDQLITPTDQLITTSMHRELESPNFSCPVFSRLRGSIVSIRV